MPGAVVQLGKTRAFGVVEGLEPVDGDPAVQELLVRGAAVPPGYFGSEDADAFVERSGTRWLRTRDAVRPSGGGGGYWPSRPDDGQK